MQGTQLTRENAPSCDYDSLTHWLIKGLLEKLAHLKMVRRRQVWTAHNRTRTKSRGPEVGTLLNMIWNSRSYMTDKWGIEWICLMHEYGILGGDPKRQGSDSEIHQRNICSEISRLALNWFRWTRTGRLQNFWQGVRAWEELSASSKFPFWFSLDSF